MNNPLKIGVISGLIAGFVGGIVFAFVGLPLLYNLGIEFYHVPETFYTTFARVKIIISLIFGAIMGAIYSRVYRLIRSRNIFRGIIFSIFGFLLYNVYFAFNEVMYGRLVNMVWFIVAGLFIWIPFGIVLGISYDMLSKRCYPDLKEPKIITYNMRGGVHPGAFAGFLGGVSTFLTIYTFMITGFWELYPLEMIDIHFILNQLGSQIMWHMLWGIMLGAIYPKVYNLVPGKGVIKGLAYGLIANFLINELRFTIWSILFEKYAVALLPFVIGGIYAIIYGLVLGFLYKPTK
jgi:hypothetical protein